MNQGSSSSERARIEDASDMGCCFSLRNAVEQGAILGIEPLGPDGENLEDEYPRLFVIIWMRRKGQSPDGGRKVPPGRRIYDSGVPPNCSHSKGSSKVTCRQDCLSIRRYSGTPISRAALLLIPAASRPLHPIGRLEFPAGYPELVIPALSLLFGVCFARFPFTVFGCESGQGDRVVHSNADGGLRGQVHFLALAFHDVDALRRSNQIQNRARRC